MMYELLSKSLFRIEDFKARLAAVEAERDAARAGEARAVEALENVRIGWLSDNDYKPGIPEIWLYIANRAAALGAGGGKL